MIIVNVYRAKFEFNCRWNCVSQTQCLSSSFNHIFFHLCVCVCASSSFGNCPFSFLCVHCIQLFWLFFYSCSWDFFFFPCQHFHSLTHVIFDFFLVFFHFLLDFNFNFLNGNFFSLFFDKRFVVVVLIITYTMCVWCWNF